MGRRNASCAQRRLRVAQAAAAALNRALASLADPTESDYAQQLLTRYESRVALYTANGERRLRLQHVALGHRRIVMLALEAERAELRSLRDQGVINDETARELEPRIDYMELYAAGGASKGGH